MPTLPRCVHSILHRGAKNGLVPLNVSSEPRFADWYIDTGLAMAYVLHYSGNQLRRRFQEQQLPQLGLNVSLVTAYDRQAIDAEVRACTALAVALMLFVSV